MNRESLLAFMQRILENGSALKSSVSLRQLATILEQQNADPELVNLVDLTLNAISEAKEAAKGPVLTEETLRIAIRRAEDRRRREAAARSQGRC